MNKTAKSKSRQPQTEKVLHEGQSAIQARLENLALRHRIDTEVSDLIKERNFWFNLANDFRYHHALLTLTNDEFGDGRAIPTRRENLRLATLDLLLAPSEPSSPIARNSRHDPQARRQGFGIASDTGWVQEAQEKAQK